MPTTPLHGHSGDRSSQVALASTASRSGSRVSSGLYLDYSNEGFPFETTPGGANTNGEPFTHSRAGSNGIIPPRKSVQFDKSQEASSSATPAAGLSNDGSVEDGTAAPRPRERLKARMRSFGLPKKPRHGHTRSTSGPHGQILDEDAVGSHDAGYHTEVEGEHSAGEHSTPSTPALGKRRRIHLPERFYSHTEPNTPVNMQYKIGTSTPGEPSNGRLRPPMPLRRATMTDIPEQSSKSLRSLSEDEGHHRVGKSPAWKRRGSAWLQQAQSQSFIATRRRSGQGSETPATKDRSSTPKRPQRVLRSKTAADSEASPAGWGSRKDAAQVFRKMRNQIKLRIAKRKEKEEGVDYVKSNQLMGEMMLGWPAAVILASALERDEHNKKKIPVLLEQLKIDITHTEFVENDSRNPRFRIELEYGNGEMRMKWTIWRFVGDFANLYLKYKAITLGRKTGVPGKGKLPHLSTKVAPILRGARGSHVSDEDEEEGEYDEELAETGSTATPVATRPTAGHSRRISYHTRLSSAGGLHGIGKTEVAGSDALGSGKREGFAEKQRRMLERYLRKLITYFRFRTGSNRLCKFLEISALGINLAAEGTYHGKEGVLTEKSGVGLAKTVNTKWFLIRQSCIVSVQSPELTELVDVFLVDPDFECQTKRPRIRDQKNAKDIARTAKTSAAHPKHHRLKLSNSERGMTLIARHERQQEQFAESIAYMKDNTEWSQHHRFDSYAPLRKNVFAEWLVDARDYMWKVSRAINMAKEVIYIHDWWLSPELQLRRPPAISHKWRLDRLLQRKAQEGVKIYVIMYRNINSAIPIDSEYSKTKLLDLHPNIYVQRSPNQYRQNVFFWAHHEKLCVVDHIIAFCGGVDLCFGRWDTPQHRVMDDKASGLEERDGRRDVDTCQLWPGKDYSNPRVQDFFRLDDPYGEMYNRQKVPRMPWHDIGMQIVGQPARDLTRHFVQRWNFLLRQRTPHRPTPVLLPPPDFDPHDLHGLGLDGTCDIQMLRSCGEWSMGTQKTERSIQNAYIKLIEESDHFVYIENQFYISSCTVEGTKIENKIGDALVDRIIKAHERDEEWMAVIIIPLMPGFQNSVHEADGTSVRLIMACQFRSICRGELSIWGRLLARGIEPTDYIQFYSLRAWGKIGPDKALTSEQLYIHAKCMIVDDRHVIIGSANINERSMAGNRDSEVAAVVRDKDMIDSVMGGEPYKVGRFPHTLRMRLMREHLGLDVDAIRAAEINDHNQKEKDEQDREDLDSSPSSSPDLRMESGTADEYDTIPRTQSLDDLSSRGTIRRQDLESLMRDPVPARSNGEGSCDHSIGTYDSVPRRAPSKGRCDHSLSTTKTVSMTEKAMLPPAELTRTTSRELGLPLLSQLPPLPKSDDTDIGGLPMKISSLTPLATEMQQPVVEQDCMRDPLSEAFRDRIWHTVAENNTKLFRQVFRCMPDDQVKDRATYWEFVNYSERFSESQGLLQPKDRPQTSTPNKTGPPGTGAELAASTKSFSKSVTDKMFDQKIFEQDKEKEAAINGAINTHSASTLGNDLDVRRLHTGVSAASTNGTAEHSDSANEKLVIPTNDSSKSRVGFDTLPSKDGTANSSVFDEKQSLAAANGAANTTTGNSTRKRRRTTLKSNGLRATDPILSTEQAEELLNMVQGHLVVFPYHWLEREEEGSKWLYGVDQMAPLEIYD